MEGGQGVFGSDQEDFCFAAVELEEIRCEPCVEIIQTVEEGSGGRCEQWVRWRGRAVYRRRSSGRGCCISGRFDRGGGCR